MNTHVCKKCNACRVPDGPWHCGPCYRKEAPNAPDRYCPDPLPLEPGDPGYVEQPSSEGTAESAAPTPDGISLRDYFAAKAMQAMLTPEESFPQKEDDKSWYAKHAYEMADAMLKARAKDMPA